MTVVIAVLFVEFWLYGVDTIIVETGLLPAVIDVRASEVMVIFVISIPCVCLLSIPSTKLFRYCFYFCGKVYLYMIMLHPEQ